MGAVLFDAGHLPRTDDFSYTAAGASWVDHEWLSGVVFYALLRVGGEPALQLFKYAAAACALGLVFAVHRSVYRASPVWGRERALAAVRGIPRGLRLDGARPGLLDRILPALARGPGAGPPAPVARSAAGVAAAAGGGLGQPARRVRDGRARGGALRRRVCAAAPPRRRAVARGARRRDDRRRRARESLRAPLPRVPAPRVVLRPHGDQRMAADARGTLEPRHPAARRGGCALHRSGAARAGPGLGAGRALAAEERGAGRVRRAASDRAGPGAPAPRRHGAARAPHPPLHGPDDGALPPAAGIPGRRRAGPPGARGPRGRRRRPDRRVPRSGPAARTSAAGAADPAELSSPTRTRGSRSATGIPSARSATCARRPTAAACSIPSPRASSSTGASTRSSGSPSTDATRRCTRGGNFCG